MYIITLLRHGRSLADDEKKFEGRYDSPLTDAGRRQAEKLGQNWANDPRRRYNKIICSPLKRAHETAQILDRVLKAGVETDALWMELDNGNLAGMDRKEGDKLYPMPDFSGPYDRIVKGSGESVVQAHTRALNAMEKILNRQEGAYLIVAHGYIINAALRGILGMPLPVNFAGASFVLQDNGYVDLRYEKQGHKWQILNLTSNPG